MLRPNNVSYWLKGLATQNFGDFLSELLFLEFTRRGPSEVRGGQPKQKYEFIYLIGSVISDAHIRRALEHSKDAIDPRFAFWCCGKRDSSKLDKDLLSHCVFLGARGPLTRDALGLPADTPLGDPALLLPAIYKPNIDHKLRSRSICVPHFLETKSDDELMRLTGVDHILRPNIDAKLEALFTFVDQLASARFVLCGALHAAIVCCAFGVEFSYFDSGYVDVPFKWEDFAASVGIGARFARTLTEGEAIHARDIAGRVHLPELTKIGRCAPFTLPQRLRRRIAAIAH